MSSKQKLALCPSVSLLPFQSSTSKCANTYIKRVSILKPLKLATLDRQLRTMWLCLNASFGLAKMQFFWTSSSFLSHQRANDSFKKYLFENFLPHSYYISKQLLVQVLFFYLVPKMSLIIIINIGMLLFIMKDLLKS